MGRRLRYIFMACKWRTAPACNRYCRIDNANIVCITMLNKNGCLENTRNSDITMYVVLQDTQCKPGISNHSAQKHQIWLLQLLDYSHCTTGHKKTLNVFSTPPLGKEACDWTTAALARVIIQPLSELTPSSVPTSSSPRWAHGQHPAVWPLSPERWLGLYPAGALYSEKWDRDVCVTCDTYGDQHGIRWCFRFCRNEIVLKTSMRWLKHQLKLNNDFNWDIFFYVFSLDRIQQR